MARILVAECIYEVCSFNPVPTRYTDFSVVIGEQITSYHRGVGSEVGGALQVFASVPDIEVIPTYSARGITSGGTIAGTDFDRLAADFLNALKRAPAADGVYFALHGAMAAENEDDPEGFLLAEARKILGEQIPIVVSLDLHGVLTDPMLEHADAVVVYHTYPHIDFFETGQRAARLLLRMWLAGRTALLQADTLTLVGTSRPVHLFDRSLFFAHGQDPKQFDLVVVKSPHCQPHMFADWCARLINVDAPGSTSANLRRLGHTRCRRPIFPLDGEVPFVPQTKLFRGRLP